MALKTEKPPEAPPAPPETTVLELAMYKKYTWQGTTYEGGKPYRFRNADALRLMSERDHDRPIWKVHRPVRRKEVIADEIVDATMVQVNPPMDEFGAVIVAKEPSKRIDIGDDSEIQDILSQVSTEGDVTV